MLAGREVVDVLAKRIARRRVGRSRWDLSDVRHECRQIARRDLRAIVPLIRDAFEQRLLSDRFCDDLISALVERAGDNPHYTSDKVPFARWDMKAVLRETLAAHREQD